MEESITPTITLGPVTFNLTLLAMTLIAVLVVFGLFAVSSAITVPTLNATLSKTDNQHKGTLMGFASTAGTLSKVIAPLLTGYLYESNIELPYITTGGISLIGVVICYIWIKNQSLATT